MGKVISDMTILSKMNGEELEKYCRNLPLAELHKQIALGAFTLNDRIARSVAVERDFNSKKFNSAVSHWIQVLILIVLLATFLK